MKLNAVQEGDELATLRSENARLFSLLEAHGIEWQLPLEPTSLPTPEFEQSNFSAMKK